MPSPGGVGILENPSFCDPIRYLYFCCNFGPCPERLLFYLSSVLQIFDRDLLSPGYTADGWTAFWIYCDRTLLLLTLGVVTYLIIIIIINQQQYSSPTILHHSNLKPAPSPPSQQPLLLLPRKTLPTSAGAGEDKQRQPPRGSYIYDQKSAFQMTRNALSPEPGGLT